MLRMVGEWTSRRLAARGRTCVFRVRHDLGGGRSIEGRATSLKECFCSLQKLFMIQLFIVLAAMDLANALNVLAAAAVGDGMVPAEELAQQAQLQARQLEMAVEPHQQQQQQPWRHPQQQQQQQQHLQLQQQQRRQKTIYELEMAVESSQQELQTQH